MEWAAEQARIRDRHWESLERLLRGLPQDVAEPFRLLEFELALHHSPTGRLRDVFTGVEQPPLPWVGPWLLSDLGCPPSPSRDAVAAQLFAAGILLGAREHLVRRLADSESFAAGPQLTLALFLSERAAALLTAAAGDGWLDLAGEQPQVTVSSGDPDEHLLPRWSEPMRRLGDAAVAAADLEIDGGRVERMLHLLAVGIEIRAQLATMHEDLLRGRTSYPIGFVARTAGISLRPWPRAELILGAMVLRGCHLAILDCARSALAEARGLAERLSLPTFAGYLGDAEANLADAAAPAVGAEASSVRGSPLVVRSERPLVRATDMARGYLLSDPNVRGSWEVHREGMFEAGVVSSRFPAALILERLAWHGETVAEGVEAFVDATVRNGFRYYDHPLSGIDTDTIGAFLRLMRYAPSPDVARTAVRDLLDCLGREVETSGRVPVWLDCGGDPRAVLDLGEDCGTVAGHLLLGIAELPGESLGGLIDIGARHLLESIGSVGLQANRNYPPAFALGVWQRVIETIGLRSGLAPVLEPARGVVRAELERLSRLPVRSAQEAAMLVTACVGARRPEHLDERWLGIMLRAQRSDGSWPDEPFTVTPNRGAAVTWYATSPMTTALVYDALQRWEVTDP
jgi:hypothetical protein